MTTVIPELDKFHVLTHKCHEPEGDFERSIRLMPLSMPNLKNFWDKARVHRTLFNEEIRGDFKEFLKVFLVENAVGEIEPTGLFWVMDDFAGVFYLSRIIPGRDAHAHVNMLDGRFKGREEITKRLLLHAFEKYSFHRLTVQVPVYIKPNVIRFIRRLGFVSEGRIREVVPYKGKWFDVFAFGILKDEIVLKESENG
ncbi:MAG: GNAT family N-acetyltransferase [Planctomycetota bacterium]|jgi:RimJ/RimL family protein N-acetyltransferase